jgi:hypothetical protein
MSVGTPWSRALGDLDVALQHQRDAYGRYQRSKLGRAAKRPIGDALDHPAIDGRDCAADHQHGYQGEGNRLNAEIAKDGKRDGGDIGRYHIDVAMSKVDHPDDAVDHGVSDRDQAVDRPQRDAIEQLLNQDVKVHGEPLLWFSGMDKPAEPKARRDLSESLIAL